MSNTSKIVLISSNQLFRDGFSLFLESHNRLEVILRLAKLNGKEVLLINSNPDLIILDFTEDVQRNLNVLCSLNSVPLLNVKTLCLSSLKNLDHNFLLAKLFKISAFLSKNQVEPNVLIKIILTLKNQSFNEIIVEDNFHKMID